MEVVEELVAAEERSLRAGEAVQVSLTLPGSMRPGSDPDPDPRPYQGLKIARCCVDGGR